MVSHPRQWVADFAAAGASQFTFHIESDPTTERAPGPGDARPEPGTFAAIDYLSLVDAVRETGMKCGVALSPGTAVDARFLEVAAACDLALVMTVEPGFGGQSFMADCARDKCREIREKLPDIDIGVDGGVGPSNAGQCAAWGANAIVSGSAVFGAKDVGGAISEIRAAIAEGRKGLW
eukprot:TRINITY_DN256_c0_g1_i1.p1 TRINITY_DN256_c0_g1~~TRINITY_DN256_c0_g1_i1.p1  ORF type:complete len:178 (+),score=79.45 TRINITY_DN256_c0_g1_i1:321-854(+)